MRTSILALILIVASRQAVSTAAQNEKLNEPPAGFTALFNGQDLAGWYGMASVSPADIAAMTDDDRAKKKAADTEDALKHWSVENGELVNDGSGRF